MWNRVEWIVLVIFTMKFLFSLIYNSNGMHCILVNILPIVCKIKLLTNKHATLHILYSSIILCFGFPIFFSLSRFILFLSTFFEVVYCIVKQLQVEQCFYSLFHGARHWEFSLFSSFFFFFQLVILISMRLRSWNSGLELHETWKIIMQIFVT